MAPMTRSFSPEEFPLPQVAEYYARRAQGEVGLIVSEGKVVIDRNPPIDAIFLIFTERKPSRMEGRDRPGAWPNAASWLRNSVIWGWSAHRIQLAAAAPFERSSANVAPGKIAASR